MRYFRSLPDIKLGLFFVTRALRASKVRVEYTRPNAEGKYVAYLFSRSRHGVSALIESLVKIDPVKRIILWLPDFYCWEVAKTWDIENVTIRFYPISQDYNPCWNVIEDKLGSGKKCWQIFILVSFFGKPADVEKAREVCGKNKTVLIFDETHVRYSKIIPVFENEILLLSPYKHFPVSNGALVVVRENSIHNSAFTILDTYLAKVNKYSRGALFFADILWIAKSLVAGIFKRMPINPFQTLSMPCGQQHYVKSSREKFRLGISDYNYRLIDHIYNRHDKNIAQSDNEFYSRLTRLICRYFPCRALNGGVYNSHLFGIGFQSAKHAEILYRIFSDCKLPVSNWPDYSYANVFEESILNNLILDLANKTIYLSISSKLHKPNNGIGKKDELMLNEIENKLKDLYDSSSDRQG